MATGTGDNLKPGDSNYPYSDKDLQKKFVYDSDGNIEYVGRVLPGAKTSELKWQIRKYIRLDGVIIDKHFADGSNRYDKEMDEYASYDYDPDS